MIAEWAKVVALATSMLLDEGAELRADAESAARIDPLSICHDKQREFIESDARVRTLLGGRQGGKTFGLVVWLISGGLDRPGTLSLYMCLTAESARDIVWPEMVMVCSMLGIDSSCLSEHTLTLKLPNGSTIKCKGTDDRRSIEARRGIKIYRLAIDEMGSQPDFIAYFIDLMWPTMAKNDGQMALAGTPSVVCDGYWFDLTNDDRDKDGTPPLFTWTIDDNPAIPDSDAFIEEYLASNGLTRESVSYLREWRAIWKQDDGELVFPCERERNYVLELPTKANTGAPLDAEKWRYVIAIDPGLVDLLAIDIVAGHPDCVDQFVVHTEEHSAWIPTQLGIRLRALRVQYPRAQFVCDVGGLGKPYAVTASREYGINIIPAMKTDKASATRHVRGKLISGRLKLVMNGSEFDAQRLASEYAKLPWCAKHLTAKDGDDHHADATLYGIRQLNMFVRGETMADQRSDSRKEADRMLKQRVDLAKKRGRFS